MDYQRGSKEITNGCLRQKMKLGPKLANNAVKKIRESLLMSKAELARKAGVSALTIDRIDKGISQMELRRLTPNEM